jgi:hypothetical protein
MDEDKPSPETQMMEIMRNIFKDSYCLEEEDRDFLNRMIEWGNKKEGLNEEEIKMFKSKGLMDEENSFLVPNEYWFKGLIMPSFWMKCLMASEDLIDFTEKEEEEEVKAN